MAAQSPRDAAAKQFARAQEFHRQGRLAEAEALYREAIHQAPGHYDALHWLGLLHLGRNDAASGAACLAQALQARPDAVDTLVYLGHALNGLKRHEEALARFDQALARKPNQALGWMMHVMMGIVFALIYAFLWSNGIGAATWTGGLVFGAVHWLVVGVVMAMIPMMHAGIQSGAVQAPGMWMTNNGGMMAFMGGLVGHMIFGVIVALVYAAL